MYRFYVGRLTSETSRESMKLSVSLTVLCCILGAGAVRAEPILLSAPEKSDDGSYVLRIESEVSAFQSESEGRQLEVYRNKDGGDFQRILTGPRFTALSELVRENGTYGYRARWVSIDSRQPLEGFSFSDTVYINVTTPVPRMVKPQSDRLAVTNLSAVPVN